MALFDYVCWWRRRRWRSSVLSDVSASSSECQRGIERSPTGLWWVYKSSHSPFLSTPTYLFPPLLLTPPLHTTLPSFQTVLHKHLTQHRQNVFQSLRQRRRTRHPEGQDVVRPHLLKSRSSFSPFSSSSPLSVLFLPLARLDADDHLVCVTVVATPRVPG